MISTIYLQFHIHLLTESANLPFLSLQKCHSAVIHTVVADLLGNPFVFGMEPAQLVSQAQPIHPAQPTNPPSSVNQSAHLSQSIRSAQPYSHARIFTPPGSRGGPPLLRGGSLSWCGKARGGKPPWLHYDSCVEGAPSALTRDGSHAVFHVPILDIRVGRDL